MLLALLHLRLNLLRLNLPVLAALLMTLDLAEEVFSLSLLQSSTACLTCPLGELQRILLFPTLLCLPLLISYKEIPWDLLGLPMAADLLILMDHLMVDLQVVAVASLRAMDPLGNLFLMLTLLVVEVTFLMDLLVVDLRDLQTHRLGEL
jgi:hypothetical protein